MKVLFNQIICLETKMVTKKRNCNSCCSHKIYCVHVGFEVLFTFNEFQIAVKCY